MATHIKPGIGNRIAPPRFLIFIGVFAAGLALLIPAIGSSRGTMAAFDIASGVFLASIASVIAGQRPDGMRAAVARNDANRPLLLVITVVTMLVILVAIAGELKHKTELAAVVLVVATLALAWLFSNMIYALHYAHVFYAREDGGKDHGGLDFPDTKEPDYWDFIYFSFTLGMTFQTSDVQVTTRRVRRIVITQTLAAFVFNIGVLAFTINVLGSAG